VSQIEWSEGLPLVIGPFEVGLTETSPETAGYWEGVRRRELMIKHCTVCGRHLYPRRIFCPNCRSSELEWVKARGTGRVYSFSTIYRAPDREMEVPYTNGIVELDEGVYLFGRLVGKEHEAIAIGDEVAVEFQTLVEGEGDLPVYRLR
jgi:uncharacterized OB-fold protein